MNKTDKLQKQNFVLPFENQCILMTLKEKKYVRCFVISL